MLGDKKSSFFIVAAFLFLNVPLSHGLRILGLFPFQVRSHFVMCEELMRGLAARGHQVDVYSHFPLKESVPNYRDYSLKGTLPSASNNMTFDVAQETSMEKSFQYWFGTYQGPVCNLMGLPIFQKLLHEPPMDPPYDLVVTELSMFHCYIPFGRLLNVPVIGVITPPLADCQFAGLGTPINLASDPSISTPYVAPMSFFERLDNIITYMRTNHYFWKYSKPQDRYVEKYFGPGMPNVIDLLKDVSLVLVNHDVALSGIRTFAPKVIPVGGLHVVDHNETLPQVVQKWLDESKNGCIYFSFGSMTRIETFPKHMIQAFYQSFKNVAPVRVLLKIAKPAELPPGLPSNVLTQPWLDQVQVLKHKNVKVFVTHGGLMGTQESVHFGVPMVGVPIFGDQHFNIKAYVNKKLAVKVELHEINEETFTKALKEILYNPVYRNSIQKLSKKFKDQPLGKMDTAIYWIEYIHRYGKDALRTPVEDMTWWQASLLDIYAFVSIMLASGLYIISKLLQKIIMFHAFIRCSILKSKAKEI